MNGSNLAIGQIPSLTFFFFVSIQCLAFWGGDDQETDSGGVVFLRRRQENFLKGQSEKNERG